MGPGRTSDKAMARDDPVARRAAYTRPRDDIAALGATNRLQRCTTLSLQVASGVAPAGFLSTQGSQLLHREKNKMAKFTTIERIKGEDDGQPVVTEVADFAEATWLLTKELHDTCEQDFGTAILRDWLGHVQNQVGNFDMVEHEVSKTETHHDHITYVFQYDPS